MADAVVADLVGKAPQAADLVAHLGDDGEPAEPGGELGRVAAPHRVVADQDARDDVVVFEACDGIGHGVRVGAEKDGGLLGPRARGHLAALPAPARIASAWASSATRSAVSPSLS